MASLPRKSTVNPIMGDKAVRQALNLAIQRDVISTQLYAGEPGEPPTANILTGIAAMTSPNTSWEFNLEEAKKILDEAGWVKVAMSAPRMGLSWRSPS